MRQRKRKQRSGKFFVKEKERLDGLQGSWHAMGRRNHKAVKTATILH